MSQLGTEQAYDIPKLCVQMIIILDADSWLNAKVGFRREENKPPPSRFLKYSSAISETPVYEIQGFKKTVLAFQDGTIIGKTIKKPLSRRNSLQV